MFIWESHICVHICFLVLDQNWTLILNWNSSPDYTFHLISLILSSHSLLNFICSAYLSGTLNDWEFWLFCGWGMLSMFCNWGCCAFCGWGHWVLWGWGHWLFCGNIFGCSLSVYHHPNLPYVLPHFSRWGNVNPHEQPFSVTCLGHHHHMGDHCYVGWGFSFHRWV